MEMTFAPEHRAFRDEVRAWIQASMPPHIRAKADVDAQFSHAEVMEWHRILHAKGWVAPHWPKEHGGPGLDATARFLLARSWSSPARPTSASSASSMVGPLLMQFGTDAQKQRYLPKILAGDEVWCQGYSEPNAGSDLASLRLTAEDDGQGHFVLNGQKTWTTYAQYADWIFLPRAHGRHARRSKSGISVPPHAT
jgi:alkylation response protein AidB-like acyl-CoA dehydrogenase